MNALRAFDAAAHHTSFVRAAEEIGVEQPAISRYIADLERELGVRLFQRSHRTVSLTPAGEVFRRAVTLGLERIATGARAAASLAEDQQVVIACSTALSHLFVMPHHDTLRQALGNTVSLSILSLDYDMLDRVGKNEIDLILTYEDTNGSGDAAGDWAPLFREAVTPVCSPGFAATHTEILAGPVAAWGAMPFLRLARPASAWMTWHDWFQSAGFPMPPPHYIGFHDYSYLIQAAVAGQGLALGWRHFIDRHVELGLLVQVGHGFLESSRSCLASLSERGRRRPVARRCLDAFHALTNGAARSPPDLKV